MWCYCCYILWWGCRASARPRAVPSDVPYAKTQRRIGRRRMAWSEWWHGSVPPEPYSTCISKLLSIGLAGYPSAQRPAIKYSSNKCHKAFLTQVKLLLGGIAYGSVCLAADVPGAAIPALVVAELLQKWHFPIKDHYAFPSTLLCHDQARHGVLSIRSQWWAE